LSIFVLANTDISAKQWLAEYWNGTRIQIWI